MFCPVSAPKYSVPLREETTKNASANGSDARSQVRPSAAPFSPSQPALSAPKPPHGRGGVFAAVCRLKCTHLFSACARKPWGRCLLRKDTSPKPPPETQRGLADAQRNWRRQTACKYMRPRFPLRTYPGAKSRPAGGCAEYSACGLLPQRHKRGGSGPLPWIPPPGDVLPAIFQKPPGQRLTKHPQGVSVKRQSR